MERSDFPSRLANGALLLTVLSANICYVIGFFSADVAVFDKFHVANVNNNGLAFALLYITSPIWEFFRVYVGIDFSSSFLNELLVGQLIIFSSGLVYAFIIWFSLKFVSLLFR